VSDLFNPFAFGGSSDPTEAETTWRGSHRSRTRRDVLDDLSGSRPPVAGSEDLERILKLPRRPQVDLGGEKLSDGTVTPPSLQAQAMVRLIGDRLRRPDRPRGWRGPCKCASFNRDCILDVLPAQAWALYEAPLAGGLLGVLAPGSGKTAVGFLMVIAMWMADPACNLAVGLVPSTLVKQLVNEYKLWREHWLVPNLIWDKTESAGPHGSQFERNWPTLHIIPYSIISREESRTLLKDIGPKLVYADEMHKLSRMDSARTARFARAFSQVPSTKFCGWTGTPWDKEIEEVAHLMAFALRDRSPLPLDSREVKVWGTALNPGVNQADPGALLRMCEPGEPLYRGFRRRLVETEGVVATQEGAIATPHYIYGRYPGPMGAELLKDLKELREDWLRPDGEIQTDIFEQSKTLRELICGFYYRWIFPRIERTPDGKPTPKARAQVELWYARRKAWRKELRAKLEPREEHLDSEKLCIDAAKRFHANYDGPLPVWESETYLDWAEVENTVYHETEAVWVDDYLVNDAIAWAREYRGVIWYEHTALGHRIAQLSGLPLHEGGPGAEARILAEKGDRSLVVSIDSHGTGRDGLQRLFHEQLWTSPPSSGKLTEQLAARLHRVGQRNARVSTWINRHTPEFKESIRRAAKRGQFAGETLCGSQKLLTAICDFDLGLDEDLE
jgi:hypothetical protein